jgi:glutaredoxin
LLGLLLGGMAQGELYRWTDEEGAVHFGDRPPDRRQAEEVQVQPNVYAAPAPPAAAPAKPAAPSKGPAVVLYGTAWCGVCKGAIAYFKKNGIPFSEYDVETSAKGRADYKRFGMPGVPVILVGKERLMGFSAGAFEEAYRR